MTYINEEIRDAAEFFLNDAVKRLHFDALDVEEFLEEEGFSEDDYLRNEYFGELLEVIRSATIKWEFK